MIAIKTMIQIPRVRSHRFSTLAIGITQAAPKESLAETVITVAMIHRYAPITLVTTLITVSSECSEKSLVI